MTRYILFLILFVNVAFAQENEVIQITKYYKTVLIFPSPIIETIIGNDAVFNQNIPEKVNGFNSRILKLNVNLSSNIKGIETNLNVITKDGYNYLYIIKQTKEKPSKLTYKISTDEAIFNLNDSFNDNENNSKFEAKKSVEKIIDSLNYKSANEHKYSLDSSNNYSGEFNIEKYTRSDSLYDANPDEYYRLKCFYNQNKKNHIPRYFAKNGEIYIWLRNVFIDKDDLYFQFKMENKTTVDFDIDLINYYIATKYKTKGSNQETQIKPIYKYLEPSKVKGLKNQSFMLVFKKFSLEKKSVFRITLKEDNGARIINLDVERNLINNPRLF